MIQFSFLCRDVSYNNLSGPMPKLSARTFRIIGNPLLCGQNSVNNCSYIYPEPLSSPPDGFTGDTMFVFFSSYYYYCL
ncbi:putative non-specific serine/threonine protein kinase [Helianthus debilis subsp. tardiflorus]